MMSLFTRKQLTADRKISFDIFLYLLNCKVHFFVKKMFKMAKYLKTLFSSGRFKNDLIMFNDGIRTVYSFNSGFRYLDFNLCCRRKIPS